MNWQPIETAPITEDAFAPAVRCLVFTPHFGATVGSVRRFSDGQIYSSIEGQCGEWHVTHWMPLPEPPK